MPKRVDKSTVSFGSWFLTIFVLAIPCFGIVYMVFGAISSTNESRRNFYRAHLAWIGIIAACYLAFIAAVGAPDIHKLYDRYLNDQGLTKAHASTDGK